MSNFPDFLKDHKAIKSTTNLDGVSIEPKPRKPRKPRKKLLPWKKQRLIILRRDKYKCRWCGIEGLVMVVHHLNYIEKDGSKEERKNLISLCRKCHNKFHKNSYYDRRYKCHRKRI